MRKYSKDPITLLYLYFRDGNMDLWIMYLIPITIILLVIIAIWRMY